MKFSLNIDHVATLRNARGEVQPDPARTAGGDYRDVDAGLFADVRRDGPGGAAGLAV